MKVSTISIKILSTSMLLDVLICIWYKLKFLLVLLASYFGKNLSFYSHHTYHIM